ncbi:NifB/NifX family molybdenum-iron cluster-binding protein [Geofilum sp. OHC36d9]|uniref:NifB/NifX family molybdenum-iron cluster-binding protein n=1 Tax=Geofilum sp. OHC36d9 TaxID=3458413 RepID=UPI004034D909
MNTQKLNPNIRFAFAVSHSNLFETTHFGDADKYLIFEWNGNEMTVQNEIINTFKSFDEEQKHGSKKKGNAIIELLQKSNIQVLVSKQFGRNIKMVNKFFIPVIIDKEKREEALAILCHHIGWIEEELQKKETEYKLFKIKNGILKTDVKQTK